MHQIIASSTFCPLSKKVLTWHQKILYIGSLLSFLQTPSLLAICENKEEGGWKLGRERKESDLLHFLKCIYFNIWNLLSSPYFNSVKVYSTSDPRLGAFLSQENKLS